MLKLTRAATRLQLYSSEVFTALRRRLSSDGATQAAGEVFITEACAKVTRVPDVCSIVVTPHHSACWSSQERRPTSLTERLCESRLTEEAALASSIGSNSGQREEKTRKAPK